MRVPRLRHRVRRRRGLARILLRPRPLAGCRLSRETGPAVLPVHWPWSPSLPAAVPRLGPPFDGLPVLRDHPTPLVSSSSRLWFLDDYRPSAEAERPPRVRTQNFMPTPSPIRPSARRILGFAAVGQLTRGFGRLNGASLSLGSALHLWTSIGRPLAGPPPSPHRAAPLSRWCGFPPSGPQEDLVHIGSSPLLFSPHVLRPCRAHRSASSLRSFAAERQCRWAARDHERGFRFGQSAGAPSMPPAPWRDARARKPTVRAPSARWAGVARMGWALFRLVGGATGDQFRPGTTAVIPLIWQLSEQVWRCRLRLVRVRRDCLCALEVFLVRLSGRRGPPRCGPGRRWPRPAAGRGGGDGAIERARARSGIPGGR